MSAPLEQLLRRLILAQGPQSVAAYMALCLAHREHGYYATRDPLGAKGDFVTAPEISQIFGELIGAAIAQAWLELGRPEPARIVEVGPGHGTLMADCLRALRTVPALEACIELHLVETSPAMRERQRANLPTIEPVWHETLATVPGGGPVLLVANEFLDALPARQFLRGPKGWQERLVGLDEAERLVFLPGGQTLPLDVPGSADFLELAPAREAWVAELALRLVQQGGVAWLIDYGEEIVTQDTLQGIRGHREVDPLDGPGTADLSTHVAFGALKAAARKEGARAFGPLPQGSWLARLGAEARLQRLAARATPEETESLVAGVRRLVEPEAMGRLFKVLALAGPAGPLPAGFEAPEEVA
jgi:NADH dehydrogenase [ubiquinone] 1 alpha subcomplex assembly factor 7